MTGRERETLGILAESPLWKALTPCEKYSCLKETENLRERKAGESRFPGRTGGDEVNRRTSGRRARNGCYLELPSIRRRRRISAMADRKS